MVELLAVIGSYLATRIAGVECDYMCGCVFSRAIDTAKEIYKNRRFGLREAPNTDSDRTKGFLWEQNEKSKI